MATHILSAVVEKMRSRSKLIVIERSKASSCIVLHSAYQWLPITQSWLYNQILYLPASITSHVACEEICNLEQFPTQNLHSLSQEARWRWGLEKLFRKVGIWRALPFLGRQAKRSQAKILHSHFGNYGWANLSVAQKYQLKHLVTFYGLDVNQLPQQDSRWRSRYQEMFQQIDRVLCEGPHMAQCIVQLGCPAEKVSVHHLGVNLDKLPFQPREWHPGKPLRVLMAASFREKKGLTYALEALGKLNADVSLDITLIGDSGSDAESQQEKQRIVDIIQQYSLNVELLGYQPHDRFLQEAYKHHLFLSPSVAARDGDTEGGAPVSIIEAAASGMPVISTDHCDIPEVLRPYPVELFAQERNVEDLVRILKWWIGHSKEWQGVLSKTRIHIETEFDAKIQGQKLGAIYQDVMETEECC
jgi:colanic acid/amylovoran biosynthesis glycosyltransferase